MICRKWCSRISSFGARSAVDFVLTLPLSHPIIACFLRYSVLLQDACYEEGLSCAQR